ncbi:MAG: glycosyltransferase [Bryobacteraceae bacterium]
MIGKFPPIEGGVSMHQYWCAHSLARLGHQIHVITNAREVESQFRMCMRPDDWQRCEGEYPSGGYVRVHWTDAYDERQRHIPWHNPYATKLASLAAQVLQDYDLELIFSYYLEPYGVAGYLASQITGRPHVVKHAGSDAGRLLLHPQMGVLYEHIFRTAARIVTGGVMANRLRELGLTDQQLFLRDDFRVPQDVFRPVGEALDLETFLNQQGEASALLTPDGPVSPPFVGVYGKLGEAKGTFDLLQSVKRLRSQGVIFTLVVLGRGFPRSEDRFRRLVAELGLRDCVLQLPFLPHWRIPDFIRMCQAVCFLERDFPISFHAPTVPREVFACGKCLIASSEVLNRQLLPERLIDRYNCLAVNDVRDQDVLSAALNTAIRDPARAEAVGKRGYEYSLLTEEMRRFPKNYESLFAGLLKLDDVADSTTHSIPALVKDKFQWSRQIVESLPANERERILQTSASHDTEESWALSVYAGVLDFMETKGLQPGILVEAMRMELRLAGIFEDQVTSEPSLFRLETDRIPVLDEEIDCLYPIKAAGLRVEEYTYDSREMLQARSEGQLPLWAAQNSSRVALLRSGNGSSYRLFWLSTVLDHLLDLCDGSRTVRDLIASISCGESTRTQKKIREYVIDCFKLGLLKLASLPDRSPEAL